MFTKSHQKVGRTVYLTVALVLLLSPLQAKESAQRYIVLGTAIGEMLYAFGEGDSVIARDVSCQVPAAILKHPSIGYHRQLPVEGVFSMEPTAIFITDAAGPPNTIAQLKASDILIHEFSSEPTLEALRGNIAQMGEVLGKPERAIQLLTDLEADLAEIPEVPSADSARVLFLLSPPGSGSLLAAGSDTAANKMIQLAGAENAFADMRGYRSVNAESIAEREPDFIILPRASTDGKTGMAVQHPVIKSLIASGKSQLITIDPAQKLAFGISTGSAAKALHEEIYN